MYQFPYGSSIAQAVYPPNAITAARSGKTLTHGRHMEEKEARLGFQRMPSRVALNATHTPFPLKHSSFHD